MLKIKSLKNHAWKFFGTEKSTKLRFESKKNNLESLNFENEDF